MLPHRLPDAVSTGSGVLATIMGMRGARECASLIVVAVNPRSSTRGDAACPLGNAHLLGATLFFMASSYAGPSRAHAPDEFDLAMPRRAVATFVDATRRGDWDARVPELYTAHGPSPLETYLPPALKHDTLGMARWQWLGIVVAIVLALLGGRALAYIMGRMSAHMAARTRASWDDELVVALRSPARLLFSVFTFGPLIWLLALPGGARLACWRAASTLGLAAIAWSVIRILGVVSKVVEGRALKAESGSGTTLRTRGVRTQVRVLRRVVTLVLVVCSGAVMLMQFEVVRSAGVSLLASAGLAGVVLGLAAQRTLSSLIAGIQLSITQPIRMGDEIVIENESGIIEEITLTYVVVRIWDERRLIVPMSRFLEHPFQNWTKVTSELHGTVMLHATWKVSVDALRAELDRLLKDNPLWDGRSKAVHVTDAKDRSIELRVLVSASNAKQLFELRAELRERLVAWLARLDESGKPAPASAPIHPLA